MIKSTSLSMISTGEFAELSRRETEQYRYDAYVMRVQIIGSISGIKSAISDSQFNAMQYDGIIEFSSKRDGFGVLSKRQIDAASLAKYPLSAGDCVAFLQEKNPGSKVLGKLHLAKRIVAKS